MTPEGEIEASGLLEGLEGDELEARRALVSELLDAGHTPAELRAAAAENRLTLLGVERALSPGGERYSRNEIAERTGAPAEVLRAQWQALGAAVPDDDEEVMSDEDLAAAKRLAALFDAGIEQADVLEMARVLGMSMSQVAAAARGVIGRNLIQPGDDEAAVAERLARATEMLAPMMHETLAYAFNLQLREQIRRDTIGAGDIAQAGTGTTEVTVCFADLVGFTKLGESVPPEEVGAVTGRLSELASATVRPSVRLVKLIGDAVMLVSEDASELTDVALELVEAAEAEGEAFPALRAGVASGEAVARSGDFYGRPVNLASRVAGVARPGSVLADDAAKEAAGEGFHYSFAGTKRLKGIGTVPLHRVRQPRSED